MACRPAITSMSLGRAWAHELPTKFAEANRYGIQGIELFYEDLEHLAKSLPGGASEENLHTAAQEVRFLCDQYSLAIICLQPFMLDEGLVDRIEHKARIKKLHLWLELARILRTDLIAIASSYLPVERISSDINLIISDLQEVADLGAQRCPPVRFTYESLAWGTRVDTWEVCWDIVRRVNRPNFGICLDTFNIAGRVYADPTADTGMTTTAETDIESSIERLIHTVDVSKIFYVQVVDAEKLKEPLLQEHEFYNSSQPPRMSWSRNCRLFYGEDSLGAYLPIQRLVRAIFQDLGFRGWVSMELFNRDMASSDPTVPADHARRAFKAWNKIVEDCNLKHIRDAQL
ncbi:xylose isomerase-like protein [Viridothelium virens]|uniref:Xylose isomerase-like protein n=1 Tax=Viridothelium virens TaxID=1048519 RepID=A0A6A6HEG5_VIRVR|nr:xylose isomerase-like protein [Viridothelium virens]